MKSTNLKDIEITKELIDEGCEYAKELLLWLAYCSAVYYVVNEQITK